MSNILYRIDYITKNGVRGTWDYEKEYPDEKSFRQEVLETVDYAKSRMPEIKNLIGVKVTEEDLK